MTDEFKKVIGTPSMMLLPARNYTFKLFKQNHSIIIPRKGMYKDLDAELFNDSDGSFNVMAPSEEEDGDVLFMPSLSKIMFAVVKYPDLSDDQAFVPIVIIIRKDEVEIVGNIIQMLKEN